MLLIVDTLACDELLLENGAVAHLIDSPCGCTVPLADFKAREPRSREKANPNNALRALGISGRRAVSIADVIILLLIS